MHDNCPQKCTFLHRMLSITQPQLILYSLHSLPTKIVRHNHVFTPSGKNASDFFVDNVASSAKDSCKLYVALHLLCDAFFAMQSNQNSC